MDLLSTIPSRIIGFLLPAESFPYPWQRTSVTFDPDLNPEGFDEKASFDFSGPLQNVNIQGIELLYNQANGKPGIPSQDSYAVGMQFAGRLVFGRGRLHLVPEPQVEPSGCALECERIRSGSHNHGVPASHAYRRHGSGSNHWHPGPGEGQGCAKGTSVPAFPPCVFAPNGMTNATYVDSKGVVHFYSGYNYADFILPNQIQTGLTRLPINVLLEFLDNLDAENHPLSTKGTVLTHLGSQNKEYGVDASVGQVKNKNDIQIGYAWYREEQDAAIASFVESDQRAPTNILQNRFYALWKLRANTLASFTWWRGRVLNTYLENNAALFNNYSSLPTISKAGEQEPYLDRVQFDLIYTF